MTQIVVADQNGTEAIITPQEQINVVVSGLLKGDPGATGPAGATGATGATGSPGAQGIQGPVGPQGSQGVAGANGVNGSTLYSGAGAPGTLHANGDYYLNTTNGDLYVQTSGAWGSPIGNLKGPTGATGATGSTGATGAAGTNGTNGSVWYEGAGVPSSGLGANGDYYLNISNGDVYTKAAGSWGSPITNLTGPAGAGSGDMILASTQTNTGKKTFNAGTLVDKGEQIYDVKGYGAIGNGSTDDTTAIQAALDAAHAAGGGIVFFPIGTYKITAALTIYSQQVIQGAGTKASIIRQFTNNTNALAGVDIIYTTIRDIGIDTNAGVTHTTNAAIKFTWSGAGNVEQMHVQDVWIGAGYFYGIYAETLITSQLSNIEVFGCDIGFYFTNGGTSTLINNTYANACNIGYQLDGCVYMSFNATACDGAKLAYYLNNCSGVAFSGCGAESPVLGGSAPSDGRMWYLTACVGVSLYNCWTYLNSKYAFYASNCSSLFLANFTENTPGTLAAAPTNAIYIHTDCARVTVLSPNCVTANQLQSASTITTVISDNGGAVTFPGNMTVKGAFLGRFTINGANGNLMAQADTDGGEFNLFSDATGNLAIYGSAAAILHLNLLDGDFKTNSTVRLTNAGLLQNIGSLNGQTIPASAIVGLTDTQTLTNKRVTRRTNTTASSATPAINTDTTDEFTITALAAAITSMTTNLTGTPVNGDELMIRIKDNGTARAITWGASFVSSGVATLLATTVVNKTHYVKLRYDSTAAKWVCMAVDATGY